MQYASAARVRAYHSKVFGYDHGRFGDSRRLNGTIEFDKAARPLAKRGCCGEGEAPADAAVWRPGETGGQRRPGGHRVSVVYLMGLRLPILLDKYSP